MLYVGCVCDNELRVCVFVLCVIVCVNVSVNLFIEFDRCLCFGFVLMFS